MVIGYERNFFLYFKYTGNEIACYQWNKDQKHLQPMSTKTMVRMWTARLNLKVSDTIMRISMRRAKHTPATPITTKAWVAIAGAKREEDNILHRKFIFKPQKWKEHVLKIKRKTTTEIQDKCFCSATYCSNYTMIIILLQMITFMSKKSNMHSFPEFKW